jgi:hypothetical protein
MCCRRLIISAINQWCNGILMMMVLPPDSGIADTVARFHFNHSAVLLRSSGADPFGLALPPLFGPSRLDGLRLIFSGPGADQIGLK